MNQEQAIQACSQEVQELVQSGVDPALLMQLGTMASQAVSNPRMKQQLAQSAYAAGILDQQDLRRPLKLDDLAIFVVLGQAAQRMYGGQA